MKRGAQSGPKKGNQLHIRLSDEQKAALQKAAEKRGLSVSSWMLSMALREAAKDAS